VKRSLRSDLTEPTTAETNVLIFVPPFLPLRRLIPSAADASDKGVGEMETEQRGAAESVRCVTQHRVHKLFHGHGAWIIANSVNNIR
jgi:hypothetical protein